jgi:hypothetical protein
MISHKYKVECTYKVIIDQLEGNMRRIEDGRNHCLQNSIILHESLERIGISSTLKSGIASVSKVNGVKEAYWHCWVDVGQIHYDLATDLRKRLSPETKGDIVKLSNVDKYRETEWDTPETAEARRNNERHFKSYKENPSLFWEKRKDILGPFERDLRDFLFGRYVSKD